MPIVQTLPRPARLYADAAVAGQLRRHLGGHHPLHGELVDEVLRRVSGHHRAHAVGPAAHILRGSKLVDRRLERCQLRLGGIGGCDVGGMLSFGVPLHSQLAVKIQLCRMHGLGGLLGLPG